MHARATFKTLVLVIAACGISLGANALNSGITYQGRILKPDGTPLAGTSVQFKMQIRSPDANNCLMYEEQQVLDMHTSNGVFALTMNDGSGTRTDATGLNLDRILSNASGAANVFTFNPATCSAGSNYTAGSSDGRNLVVLFKDETMATWEPMPAQKINFAPFAFEAKQIAGFTPASLVRVAESDGTLDTVSPLSNANYTELLALIGGTSTQYTKQSSTGGSVVSSTAGNVATPSAGSVWLDTTAGNLKFYDGSVVKTLGTTGGSVTSITTGTGLTGGPITTTGTIALATVGAGGTGYKVTYDTYGRVTGAVALVEADIPTLSAAGKVVGSAITSGTIGGSTAINTTGSISSGAILSSGLITSPSLSATAIGTQSLQVFETTNTYKVTLQSPASLAASYALTLPTTAGTSGQVLTTSGAPGLLSWTTPAGTGFMNGGNTFGANSSIGNNDNFDLTVKTSNLPRITVQAGGNVGIGTTAPSAPFEISRASGSAPGESLRISGEALPRMYFNGDGSGFLSGNSGIQFNGSNNYYFGIGSNLASPAITIQGNDAVFIPKIQFGYIGPIGGAVADTFGRIEGNKGAIYFGTDAEDMVKIYNQAPHNFATTMRVVSAGVAIPTLVVQGAASQTGDLQRWVDSSNNALAVVSSAGNVGVGTTAPGAKLDVTGVIKNNVSTFTSAFTCGSSTIDFSTSNFQRLSPSNTIGAGACGVALSNLVPGAAYTLVVTGNAATNAVTYGFTGAVIGFYTFKYLPANAATAGGGADGIYTFLYDGSTVYVTWSSGYQ